jgi:hypothetical protein
MSINQFSSLFFIPFHFRLTLVENCKGDVLREANLEKKPLEKEKPSENFQCSSPLHHGEGPGVRS